MEANELMIGDWVLINGTPRKIQAVDGVDDEIMADDELYTIAEDRYHSEDKVDGVPITPEILEKNGFKKKHPTQHFCEIVIGSFRITVQFGYGNSVDYVRIYETPNDNYIPETNINIYHPKIKYVHELQNALRLCGIKKEIVL